MAYVPETCKTKDVHAIFKDVMANLLIATHCHGCKKACAVTLIGYSGVYCRKGCWDRISYRGGCDCHTCVNRIALSKNISMYHRDYYNSTSPTKLVWPMGHKKPCTNQCVMTRPTIAIPGYNR